MTTDDQPRQRGRGAGQRAQLGTADVNDIRAAYTDFIERPEFPCVGAKSALRRAGMRIEVFDELAAEATAAPLRAVLADFAAAHPAEADAGRPTPRFATCLAVFRSPLPPDELTFERLLWLQLRQLRATDDAPGDPSVSNDPADPRFGFSVAGRAFFVVGMHPRASRLARRAPLPTLVFNLHSQFDQLRTGDRYGRMRDVIRKRDIALQGSTNPMAQDFGARSEARQYSGRAVPEGWQPPYDPGQPDPGGPQ